MLEICTDPKKFELELRLVNVTVFCVSLAARVIEVHLKVEYLADGGQDTLSMLVHQE